MKKGIKHSKQMFNDIPVQKQKQYIHILRGEKVLSVLYKTEVKQYIQYSGVYIYIFGVLHRSYFSSRFVSFCSYKQIKYSASYFEPHKGIPLELRQCCKTTIFFPHNREMLRRSRCVLIFL